MVSLIDIVSPSAKDGHHYVPCLQGFQLSYACSDSIDGVELCSATCA